MKPFDFPNSTSIYLVFDRVPFALLHSYSYKAIYQKQKDIKETKLSCMKNLENYVCI